MLMLNRLMFIILANTPRVLNLVILEYTIDIIMTLNLIMSMQNKLITEKYLVLKSIKARYWNG